MSKNYDNFETMMEKYAAAKEYLEPPAEAVQSLYQIPEGKIPKEKFHRPKRRTAYAAAAAVAVLVLGTVLYCTARLSGTGNGQNLSMAEEDTEGNAEENTKTGAGENTKANTEENNQTDVEGNAQADDEYSIQKNPVVTLSTSVRTGSDASSSDDVTDDQETSTDDAENLTGAYIGEEEMGAQHYAVLAGECLMDSFGFDVTYIYPDDFAGCYIDYDTLHVLVTGEDSLSYYEKLLADYADYVEYEIVEFSYNELYAEMEEIWDTLVGAGITPGVGYVDQENNSIEIEVGEADYAKAIEVLAGMGIDAVTLEEVPEIGDVSTIEVSEEEEVSFVVDEVLEDSAVFTFTNLSSRRLFYGTEQILEKELDGTWYQVNMKVECSWSDVGLELSSGGKDTETVNFGADSIYGELSAGHYRLIKRFEFFTRDENWVEYYEGEFYLACEFDIP